MPSERTKEWISCNWEWIGLVQSNTESFLSPLESSTPSLFRHSPLCAGIFASTNSVVTCSYVTGDWGPVALSQGFSGGSDGKESACNVGDPGLIPGLGRSPGERNGNPLPNGSVWGTQGKHLGVTRKNKSGSRWWGSRHRGGGFRPPHLETQFCATLKLWLGAAGNTIESESERHSVMSNSLPPYGLRSPWNSPGQNTGVGCLSLLQQIFPTQESNRGYHYLLHI